MRVIGSIILVKIGYELGMFEAKDVNKKHEASKVVQYESEEQIFDYLFNQ